jgi:hypothetical protein
MQENSNYTLTITGTIDGKYETERQTSEQRALSVKDYLLKNYAIENVRLSTEFVGIPSKPSAQSVRDGLVENRRVELSSRNTELFEPIFVKGEKKVIAFPDNVVFVPRIVSNKIITE